MERRESTIRRSAGGSARISVVTFARFRGVYWSNPKFPLKNKRLPSNGACEVIIVTRAGRIAFMSERAAHWLKEWGTNGKLPKPLARWLAAEAGEPFCWQGEDRNIIVRVAGRNRKGSIALILREESNTVLSLTEQETTVLRWVNYGKTDPEIAGFEKMKLGTVKKCMKRILDALGVDKRAAAAAVYERLMSERGE